MTCRASWSLFLEVSNCTALSLFCTPFLPLENWRWKTRWAPHLDLQLSAIYKWYPNPSGCIAHLFLKLLCLRQEIKSPLSFSTRQEVHWRRSDLSHLTSESQCAGKLLLSLSFRLRCWDLWAWHWHPRLRQGLSKMKGGMVVRRTFVSTLNEFHGTFPSSWSHSCMNKEPFPDIWGAAGWWNVVDSRGWTLSPFFHRHHCEQSRSSIQVSRLLRVLGLASYLMVQTVQNMPSVQPCCKVSLEQVPSEQVLGEHGHPDVQLWPAAVCWSMDHKVGSYSSNISRCLKMSQDVSRCLKSTFKASAKSAVF